MTAPVRPASFAERRTGLLLSAAVVVSLIIVSLLRGKFGVIGPDGDDVMRLVQVRALLEGQGWFDLMQPRLGLEGGTPMHWSRLVDLPMVFIAAPLAPVIGPDVAIATAITIWPLISVLIVVWGVVIGARAFGGRGVMAFAALLAFAVLYRHFRFLPGAIDHHNLQLGLILLAGGALLAPSRPANHLALAGAALGLAVAVGVEVWVFAAVLAAFVAIDWVISGEPAQRGAVAFGASFAAVIAAAFLLTVGPLDYWAVRCDAHSSVTLLAGLGGGAAFALAAQVTSEKSLAIRRAALANVAAVTGALLAVAGPQCLSNPLDALSPAAQELWLARVEEARPTLSYLDGRLDEVLFRLGTGVAGLAAAIWLARSTATRRAGLLLAVILTVSLAFALYQTRFYVFGQLFAILPLAVLAARLWSGEAGPRVPRLAYLGVVIVSVPTIWGAAGMTLSAPTPAATLARAAGPACDPRAVHAALSTLEPGRILAPASETPGLLLNTRHSALYGHYHRNAAGIEAALAIFTAPPVEARARLRSAGVDYVLVCPADPDMQFFARHSPKGLIGEILAGRAPAWLTPALLAGPASIYRVAPDAGLDQPAGP